VQVTGGEPDQLVVRARELEAAAERATGEGRSGDPLRKEAAALRIRALGERPYPILVCADCSQLTGWLDEAGVCERCARSRELREAWTAPHGGWVDLTDHSASAPQLGRKFRLGRRRHREDAALKSWLAHVDPGVTGPSAPEVGFELEVARRDEVEAPDRSGAVVRFTTARHRFDGESWRPTGDTLAYDDLWLPAEFPVSLPSDQLAEAWADYTAAVESINRRRWRGAS
jgi:hypothetical protein